MSVSPVPKTAEEMRDILFASQLHKAYELLSTEARRKRLREDDIAQVEAKVLDQLRGDMGFSHEFKTFEAEVAIADARQRLADFFRAVRRIRVAQLKQE